jgi:hypothetical protein
MSTIVTRSGKGSPLTHTEVDNNFTNLNTDKYQSGNNASFGTLSASGAFSANGGTTLGDASGDALTINSSAVSIPNGLNFDSNTFVIDATNDRVAIGTNTPFGRFRVSAGDGTQIGFNGATRGVRFEFNSTGTTINGVDNTFNTSYQPLTVGGSDVRFSTSDTERMRITSAGDVGVGTSSPNLNSFNKELTVSAGTSGTARAGINIQGSRTTDSTFGALSYYHQANIVGSVEMIRGGADNSGIMQFFTANAGTIAERMRITSTGNVGIGRTPTSQKLEVEGGVRSNSTASGTAFTLSQGGTVAYLETTGTSATPITIYTNGSERMRIDTAGNVGIGTTNPDYGSFGATERILGITGVSGNRGRLSLQNTSTGTTGVAGSIAFFNSSTQLAAVDVLADGATNSGRIVFNTNNAGTFTERMRITSSGNVLIASGQMQVSAGSGDAYSARLSCAYNFPTVDTYLDSYAGASYSGQIMFRTNSGGGAMSERMRIDSSGNLLVGATSQVSSGKLCVNFDGGIHNAIVANDTTSNTSIAYGYFLRSGTLKGSITYSSVSNLVSYNTTSDYRLKENIVTLSNALQTVSQLKPRQYDWKETGTTTTGFIAHELAEVLPHAVSGEKDAVDAEGNPKYQGIDTSFLVATLTAAIQELKAEVDALKAQINQ